MKRILLAIWLTLAGVLSLNAQFENVGGVVSIAHGTHTCHLHFTASNLGKNVSNPPVVDTYGITKVLEFTVDTDLGYYKFLVPDEYASGDITLHINWTRSTTGTDESTKTVKWQLKNLVINGTSENCNAGENTDAIQDTYDAVSTTTQIVYKSGDMTIAAAEFAAGELIILEIMAVTVDSGVALSEPALVSIGIDVIINKVYQ